MYVPGVDNEHHHDETARLVCPLFDHQEAIDQVRDRHADQTCAIHQKLDNASMTAVLDRAADKVYRLNKRALAVRAELTDALYDF